MRQQLGFFFFSRLTFFCLCTLLVLCPKSYAATNTLNTISAKKEAGPLEAIHRAQEGIDTQNDTLFAEAIDIDSILTKGAEAFAEVLSSPAAQETLAKANPLLGLALANMGPNNKGQFQTLALLLGSELKHYILLGVRDGHFAGKTSTPAKGVSPLLTGISFERKELIPGQVLHQTNTEASVNATLVDGAAGRFPLVLGLHKEKGQWRVKEISNARALLEKGITHAR